jgi:hypothetical protein
MRLRARKLGDIVPDHESIPNLDCSVRIMFYDPLRER